MNSSRFVVLVVLVVYATLPGWAQEWRIPVGGVVLDAATNSLKQILGFPGGAQLSEPVREGIDWAEVSPDGRRALVWTSAGELEWLESLSGDGLTATKLAPIGAGPYVAKWSQESLAIRVYSAECKCLQTFARNEGGAPAELGVVHYLDSELGPVSGLNWAQARTILAAEHGLYEIEAGSGGRFVLSADPNLRFFLEPNRRVWAARPSSGQIFEALRDEDGEWKLRLLVADSDRMSGVLGIASEGGSIWVADGPTESLVRVAEASGEVASSLKVPGGLSGLTRLGGGTGWLIRGRQQRGEPIYILDNSSTPVVLFIPDGDNR